MINSSFSVSLAEEKIQVLLDGLWLPDRFCWRSFRHCNAEFELHIIISGSCVLDVEGHVHPFTVGDAIVIAPNCFHSAHQVTESFERLSLSLIANTGSYVEGLLYGLSKLSTFRLTGEQIEICRLLLREANTGDLYHAELCQAYLIALLITVFRIYNPEFAATAGQCEKTESHPRLVVDRFFSSWPVPVGSEQALAQLLHISRRQVVRFLKQNYGMSFREKYIRSRMDYAAWLLRSTDLPLREIAGQVNYSSESAFLGAFKKYLGITPTEYRKTYINTKKSRTE